MAYFYAAYKKIDEFAKIHNLILLNGFYSNSEKKNDYVDERIFSMELNKNLFVATKFETDYFIVVCKKDLFKNSTAFNKMKNLTKSKRELLVIYEYEPDSKKKDMFVEENKPVVNYISLQVFLIGPLNHSAAPISVELFDFEPLEKILMIKKKDLSEIAFTDPVIAWLRLKPGQVVKIVNFSPTSGKNINYRLIL
jgi:DNA-directed RNA polymerase subunit H (RpoH/RPB5)